MACPRCNIARTNGLCAQCRTEQRVTEEHAEYRQSGIEPHSWNSRDPELEGDDAA